MKKHSLASTGLSLSQAQSISNLCNQRSIEIGNVLGGVNNYSKSVKINNETFNTVQGKKLPKNVVDLLKEKAELHATQAFLMENMKEKDNVLRQLKVVQADISGVKFPQDYDYLDPKVVPQVDETWGWEQLSAFEYNEYLEAEAYASHIGQFIHKGSTLDKLRAELPTLPAIEWMIIQDGVKSPVDIKPHHTSEELLEVHEELAGIHRGYEQRVNYFKAKVKNLITEENARIAKLNSDVQNEASKINLDRQGAYETEYKKATEEVKTIRAEFEKGRQASIKEVAALRIQVDPRFQKVVNIFLSKLPETQD
jgi:hypothetical protein